MINKSCRTFNFMFRVPDAEVPEVEAILATSHEKWMRATHQGDRLSLALWSTRSQKLQN